MAAKIMLVEDDTNLSDIYKARLEAEGFVISTANDGEAALALAVKEHPDLIISDVMMPKISGFDMLDILRGTDGIKDTKVIMMTALGQSEDKERADKLGADRYLVKSQVTLEDVVKTVHDVLGDESAAAPAVATAPQEPAASLAPAPATTPAPEPTTTQVPVAAPPADTAEVVPAPASIPVAAEPAVSAAPPASDAASGQAAALSQIQDFVDKQESDSQKGEPKTTAPTVIPPSETPAAAPEPTPQPITTSESAPEKGDDNTVTIARKKVIKPISDPTAKPDLAALLAKEENTTPATAATSTDGIFSSPAGSVVAPTDPNDPSNIAL